MNEDFELKISAECLQNENGVKTTAAVKQKKDNFNEEYYKKQMELLSKVNFDQGERR